TERVLLAVLGRFIPGLFRFVFILKNDAILCWNFFGGFTVRSVIQFRNFVAGNPCLVSGGGGFAASGNCFVGCVIAETDAGTLGNQRDRDRKAIAVQLLAAAFWRPGRGQVQRFTDAGHKFVDSLPLERALVANP